MHFRKPKNFCPKLQSAEKILHIFGFSENHMISRWAQGQPDNANGNENCLALELSGQEYAFKDENCDSSNRYICVAMDTSKSTTGGRQSQRECALAFGIDEGNSISVKMQSEIDKFHVTDNIDTLMAEFISTGSISSNLKVFSSSLQVNVFFIIFLQCFIKCMGEMTSLVGYIFSILMFNFKNLLIAQG